ncbi:MAG: hypothetical protein Q7S76_02540 [bacterium]|nr:hypothetical protein [bacterium]
MDLSAPGITYILLVIPTLIAAAVVGQGIYGLVRRKPDGGVTLVFGLIFLGLIASAYFFFIR